MRDESFEFGHFYCGFYVESICPNCCLTVAKGATERDLEPSEKAHVCVEQKKSAD
jgi:hypothetical protein